MSHSNYVPLRTTDIKKALMLLYHKDTVAGFALEIDANGDTVSPFTKLPKAGYIKIENEEMYYSLPDDGNIVTKAVEATADFPFIENPDANVSAIGNISVVYANLSRYKILSTTLSKPFTEGDEFIWAATDNFPFDFVAKIGSAELLRLQKSSRQKFKVLYPDKGILTRPYEFVGTPETRFFKDSNGTRIWNAGASLSIYSYAPAFIPFTYGNALKANATLNIMNRSTADYDFRYGADDKFIRQIYNYIPSLYWEADTDGSLRGLIDSIVPILRCTENDINLLNDLNYVKAKTDWVPYMIRNLGWKESGNHPDLWRWQMRYAYSMFKRKGLIAPLTNFFKMLDVDFSYFEKWRNDVGDLVQVEPETYNINEPLNNVNDLLYFNYEVKGNNFILNNDYSSVTDAKKEFIPDQFVNTKDPTNPYIFMDRLGNKFVISSNTSNTIIFDPSEILEPPTTKLAIFKKAFFQKTVNFDTPARNKIDNFGYMLSSLGNGEYLISCQNGEPAPFFAGTLNPDGFLTYNFIKGEIVLVNPYYSSENNKIFGLDVGESYAGQPDTAFNAHGLSTNGCEIFTGSNAWYDLSITYTLFNSTTQAETQLNIIESIDDTVQYLKSQRISFLQNLTDDEIAAGFDTYKVYALVREVRVDADSAVVPVGEDDNYYFIGSVSAVSNIAQPVPDNIFINMNALHTSGRFTPANTCSGAPDSPTLNVQVRINDLDITKFEYRHSFDKGSTWSGWAAAATINLGSTDLVITTPNGTVTVTLIFDTVSGFTTTDSWSFSASDQSFIFKLPVERKTAFKGAKIAKLKAGTNSNIAVDSFKGAGGELVGETLSAYSLSYNLFLTASEKLKSLDATDLLFGCKIKFTLFDRILNETQILNKVISQYYQIVLDANGRNFVIKIVTPITEYFTDAVFNNDRYSIIDWEIFFERRFCTFEAKHIDGGPVYLHHIIGGPALNLWNTDKFINSWLIYSGGHYGILNSGMSAICLNPAGNPDSDLSGAKIYSKIPYEGIYYIFKQSEEANMTWSLKENGLIRTPSFSKRKHIVARVVGPKPYQKYYLHKDSIPVFLDIPIQNETVKVTIFVDDHFDTPIFTSGEIASSSEDKALVVLNPNTKLFTDSVSNQQFVGLSQGMHTLAIAITPYETTSATVSKTFGTEILLIE